MIHIGFCKQAGGFRRSVRILESISRKATHTPPGAIFLKRRVVPLDLVEAGGRALQRVEKRLNHLGADGREVIMGVKTSLPGTKAFAGYNSGLKRSRLRSEAKVPGSSRWEQYQTAVKSKAMKSLGLTEADHHKSLLRGEGFEMGIRPGPGKVERSVRADFKREMVNHNAWAVYPKTGKPPEVKWAGKKPAPFEERALKGREYVPAPSRPPEPPPRLDRKSVV